MDDKFDDIEINLSEPTYSQPQESETKQETTPNIPNTPPVYEAPHKCTCQEHYGKEPNKPSWINGPFGCVVGGFVGCVVLPLLCFLIMCAGIGGCVKNFDTVTSPSTPAGNYIAVIHIDGVMTTGSVDMSIFGGNGACGSDTVSQQIRKAADDTKAKAILLRVNSPGGTPVAAEEISDAILYAKGKKTVWTSIADMGCSAAYWVSSQTDKIYVNRTTMTGSIGVIMEGIDISKLMEKFGVSSQTLKSGKYKDIGSSTRPMTDEEKQILQALIDDTYDAFLDAVSKGRKINKEEVKKLAEGKIYTGSQAVNVKLADKVGTYNECINDMAKEFNMKKPTVKDMGKSDFWSQIMEPDLKKAINLYLINELKDSSAENCLQMR